MGKMPVIMKINGQKNEVNHLLNDISISARWMVKLRGNAYKKMLFFLFILLHLYRVEINWKTLHVKRPFDGNKLRLNEANNILDGDNSIYRYFQFIFLTFSVHGTRSKKKQHQQYNTVQYSNALNDFNGKVKRFGSVWNEQRINYIFVENYSRSIYLVVLSCCICTVLGPSRRSPFYIVCSYHTVNRKDLRNEQKMPFQLIISPFFR